MQDLNECLPLIVSDSLRKRRRVGDRAPDEIRAPHEEYAEQATKKPIDHCHERYDQHMAILQRFPRAPNQVIFHTYMAATKACMYYREVLQANESAIRARNSWSDDIVAPITYIRCARRVGKSVASIMSVVADLMSMPNILITVFSITHRQAAEIPTAAAALIEAEFPDMKGKMHYRYGKLTLEFGPNDRRTVWALPGSTNVSFISRNPHTPPDPHPPISLRRFAASLS